MRGTRKNMTPSYFSEFFLRRRCGHDSAKVFVALLKEIQLQYPV
jgi:hypothetical protein